MADIKVRVGQKNAIKVTSSLAGASAGSLGELSDVNASNPQNGMVLVYINNGDISNLEFVTQTDVGDDAAPTILSNGTIIVGNKIGELRMLYYDLGYLVMGDIVEHPYCGQNLTPYPLLANEPQEFEDLLVGSKAGGIQYLSYNPLTIKKENDPIPIDFEIEAIYPNPNNGHCKIDLNIKEFGVYEISVFDIHGKNINNLLSGPLNKGKYTVALQDIISSGVYFIRLQKDNLSVIKKFVRLK